MSNEISNDVNVDEAKVVHAELTVFDSVNSGRYWRAINEIKEQAITIGMVLLIERLKYYEGQVHTVVLRTHPSNYNQNVDITDGEHVRTRSFTSHHFLYNDFVNLFEYEPDYKNIRDSEINNIHSNVAVLNDELAEAQSNPEILNRIVNEEMSKLALEHKDNPEAGKSISFPSKSVSVPQTVSNAISGDLTSENVEEMSIYAESHVNIAKVKSKWITNKTDEIRDTLNKLIPFYEEGAACALAMTDDTIRGVEKMTRGIETLHLYTGRDVVLETIVEGESAPSDIPLSLCSQKLFVDEELSIYLDLDEWFDFDNLSLFKDALRDYPQLVEQIFPTKRAMLIMATTQRDVEYDGCNKQQMDDLNKRVFLLVRNGDNVHMVWSPIGTHIWASKLFPDQKDSDDIFVGLDGEDITLEDIAFTDAVKKHESFEIHYKRWLVMCAGLNQKEKLFGDFYPADNKDGFLSLTFQKKYLNFIHENNSLEDGRVSVGRWIKQQNEYVSSGSTVYANLSNCIDNNSAPGAFIYSSREGDYRQKVSIPYEYNIYKPYKKGAALMIVGSFESRSSYAQHNVNIDLNKVERCSNSDLPYLCLDRIKVEDLNYYIKSRKARKGQIGYIRFFKKCFKYVEQIIEQEEGIRQRLTESILLLNGVDNKEDVELVVYETLAAWKSFNRGADVSKLKPDDQVSWDKLLNHAYYFINRQSYIKQIEAEITRIGYKPLRISLSGNSAMKVY